MDAIMPSSPGHHVPELPSFILIYRVLAILEYCKTNFEVFPRWTSQLIWPLLASAQPL